MIDPAMFTVAALLDVLFDDNNGGYIWRRQCEIVRDYMPHYPRPETRPTCVVKCGGWFLRHSKGPRQGHSWDIYGDDYHSPELALLAILQAPPPPQAISRETWDAWREWRNGPTADAGGAGRHG